MFKLKNNNRLIIIGFLLSYCLLALPVSAKTLWENHYLTAHEVANNQIELVIKSKPDSAIFIGYKGDISRQDINQISLEDFKRYEYILIPDDHWVADSWINNPLAQFKDKVSLTRPSIWGQELLPLVSGKQSVLFKKGDKLTALSIKNLDHKNFQAIFNNGEGIGSGMIGTAHLFNINNHEIILKENANIHEISRLESLLFTRGVIKTYAAFEYNEKYYLAMQKGLGNFKDYTQNLDQKVLIASANNLLTAFETANKMGFSIGDKKPDNTIVTNDDGLKFIDIYGTNDFNNAATVRALLSYMLKTEENQLYGVGDENQKNPIFSPVDYSDLSLFNQQLLNIINKDNIYFRALYLKTCREYAYKNCDEIKKFDDLYNKISENTKQELAKRGSAQAKWASSVKKLYKKNNKYSYSYGINSVCDKYFIFIHIIKTQNNIYEIYKIIIDNLFVKDPHNLLKQKLHGLLEAEKKNDFYDKK